MLERFWPQQKIDNSIDFKIFMYSVGKSARWNS